MKSIRLKTQNGLTREDISLLSTTSGRVRMMRTSQETSLSHEVSQVFNEKNLDKFMTVNITGFPVPPPIIGKKDLITIWWNDELIEIVYSTYQALRSSAVQQHRCSLTTLHSYEYTLILECANKRALCSLICLSGCELSLVSHQLYLTTLWTAEP